MVPLDAYDIYDYFCNTVGNLSLNWNGTKGLYETFWKDYLYWYNNLRRPVEYKRMFTPKELRDLKCYKKYRIAGTNYLVNTLDVTLRKNKIDPAKVSLFKV